MVGGFLGAGKTTAISKIAAMLTARGVRVGLITNDQSVGLVDTAILAHGDFPVEEITGGCFCCRFNTLVEASERLTASSRPGVFIAEPVGSCTDLVAAVTFPLRRIYGESYRVAPLSVLIDPTRAERILGLEKGGNFSPKVLYVYRKQLEEADIIVINKCDLLSDERQDRLELALRAAYPKSDVIRISARSGSGLEAWLDRIMGEEETAETAPDVDYEIYAEGEALLGWLNASVIVESTDEFDGNDLLRGIASRIQTALASYEVAHLKMTLTPEERGGDIGVLNLVRTDGRPELAYQLQEPVLGGELLINLRAEADPEILKAAVTSALAGCRCRVKVDHLEHFRPGKPQPTYRMAHV
ncbi:MAG: cobalamin biosynthesis protein P47K [Acidobacteria bacterium]|nr:cobalamin biosynthesis protein P47K [Acidobacteriota bacterium]